MKKRLIWFAAGLILLLLCGLAVSWNVLFPPALSRELAALVPSDPLVFIQGSQLRVHLAQFTQRPEYVALLNSEFLHSLNRTDWWPNFRENFLAFWKSLMIDPLHIVGHEMAVAVYASDRSDVLPRAILIGKTDRVARVAERLMVGYDHLAHQIGITSAQKYRQHGVYALQTYDMLWPLYYAVVGEAGLISTSQPLLHETIDLVMAHTNSSRSTRAQTVSTPTVFRQAYPLAAPQNRLLAGYIDTAGFARECRRNPFLRALGLGQGSGPVQPDPNTVFTITARSNQVSAQIRWFASAQAAAQIEPELLPQIGDWNTVLPHPLTQPLVLAANLPRMQAFIQAGQRLFPQWAFITLNAQHEIDGERFEGIVSDRILGGLYNLPEMAGLLDTADAQAAHRTLAGVVHSLVMTMLPPLLQNRIETATERNQQTEISHVTLKMPLVKQNIVHYATISHADAAAAGYITVSNSLTMLQQQLAALAAQPETSPYHLNQALFQPGFLAILSPPHTATLLKNFAQTATFAMMVTPAQQSVVKQIWPLMLQGLPLLPTITVAGETVEGQIVLDLRLHP